MRILSFIILHCVLVSQSWAADTTTIAAFGDSLFAGYGISAAEAFPARLEQQLISEGYNVKVLNLGISGDTTAGGIARVDNLLAQKPDMVILELAGNDMLRAFPPATTQNNLDTILQKLQTAGIKTILTGHVAPMNYGQKFANEFNAIFPTLAAKYNIPLYPAIMDGILGHPDRIQPDGIHPTPKGVDVMVAGIAPLVKASLKK